jgi:ribosome-associated heat shock protein Hsp15
MIIFIPAYACRIVCRISSFLPSLHKKRLEAVRVDKWLWAVRVFKTRAQSTDACKKGRVVVNGMPAKASKEIRTGDRITVRKLPVVYTYMVKQIIEKRLSAKLVSEYMDDLTSVDELDKIKMRDTFFFRRDRGTGRPTKKERRQIDKLNDELQ